MLYFLECMGIVITTIGGYDQLATTGKSVTIADIAVGLAGWYIILLFVFVICLLIKYNQNKDLIKEIQQDIKDGKRNKNKFFSKNIMIFMSVFLSIFIILFFIGLILFLCVQRESVRFASEICMLLGGEITLLTLTCVTFKYFWKKFSQW